jgi:hypothetical protein
VLSLPFYSFGDVTMTDVATVPIDSSSDNFLVESRSSVKMMISTKGIVTFEVKIYDDDPDIAKQKALLIFEELRKKYREVDSDLHSRSA